ncbi:MAG: hypothetical protein IJB86_02055 [Clostridia bacterium]|nr:hypothetical protein [Clostridia bacterium]
MFGYVISISVGLLFIAIGIVNTKGHISMLHSYHTHRVTEENRIPFGKKIGSGMMIIGSGILVSGILSVLMLRTDIRILMSIGNIVLASGFAVGLGIIFYALFKYNKGIF